MKKVLSFILAAAMAVSLVACKGEAKVESKTWDSAELETYIQTVVDNAEYTDEEFATMVKEYCQPYEMAEEMEEYNLGSTELVYSRAVMYEPLMTSQAFSLAIFTTETEEEAKTLAETLPTTVNPAKWVCVAVEEDQIMTAYNGNLVFLAMSAEAQSFIDSFNTMVNEG